MVHSAPGEERGRQLPDGAQYEVLTHWLESVQPSGQLLELPLHTKGAHEGLPATPASAVEQLPVAQVSHAPSHRVSQHTPSTQLKERHCASAVQAAANARCGTQPEGSQYWPAGHLERSAGHRGPPVQRSSRSHSPTTGRQVAPESWNSSAGQTPARQRSSRSQSPAAALHARPSQSGSAQSVTPSASSSMPSPHRNSCTPSRTASPEPPPVERLPVSQRLLTQR